MNKRHLALIVAGSVSLVGHASGLVSLGMDFQSVQIASAPKVPTQLGNGFADMVTGIATPMQPTVSPQQQPPDQIVHTTADVLADSVPPDATPPTLTPLETTLVTAPPVTPPTEISATPANPITAITPTLPASVQPITQLPAQPAARPPPQKTNEIPPVASPAPEIITAIPGPQVQQLTNAVERPRRRPANLEQPAPRGNSDQTQQRGTNMGATPQAHAVQQGHGQTQDANANTANNTREVANYGNVVMRKISRTRRQNTRISGQAVVSFRISANGGLAAISITQSSGNPDLDVIALNHVRRSAPFPVPPVGARTSFNVTFIGR